MWTQMPKYVRPHTFIPYSTSIKSVWTVSLLFLHNMWQWWTYTPVWMLLSCYICVVSNCCLSLYLNIAGLRQGPEEMLLVSWKVLEFFVTKRMGTLLLAASAPLPRMFPGLFGGHTGELCKSGWTDQDVVWRRNRLIQAPTDHTLDGGVHNAHCLVAWLFSDTDRFFWYASPCLWNQFPVSLCQLDTSHLDSSLPTPVTS